ncbi:MAG: type II secretion system protein GspE [Acidobacteria bacterium RIFCSPLOWO2_12_FULL_66_10]|nr:MAG: type II secretion system protein GspE [Acidobacteria bacterium RIFCSPLOWO2_12_FULL_66_10]
MRIGKPMSARRRLGELLMEKNLLQPDELEKALTLQRERPEKLGRVLMDLGFVSARDVLTTLSEQLDVPVITARDFPPIAPEVEGISVRFMRQFRFLPIRVEDSTVTLAMADPLDSETIASIRLFTRKRVRALLCSEQDVLAGIERYFPEPEAGAGSATSLETGAEVAEDIEQLRDMASEAPVIRLVNNLIARAVERGASDIHLEPFEKEFRVRYRLDGVLHCVEAPPRNLEAAVLSRIKLMAKLNIAERRLPQDGRIQLKILGRDVDLRVATLPTLHGESIVLRLLDRSETERYDLARLGFSDAMLARMERFAALPYGMFLVTGPTGSGKSTTLYSALKLINTADRKIITIEDPVEYQMDGINQIHVNPQIGLTFAAGLRHIVRQDPDVIMVGEIRDRETAEIAIRAALTGHLVFSTLHTNDAPSAITRLTDMGIENYLLTSSLVAVLAQRLVRVLCAKCKRPERIAGDWLRSVGFAAAENQYEIYRAAGCEHCAHTGYRGRVGIFELMDLEEEIRKRILANEDAGALAAAARGRGMRTLAEDGWEKVRSGVTSPEEVLRVTQAL